MKPSIRAESLILKPFQSQQVDMAVKEAIRNVLKKYQNPDIDKVFVVDNQEGRVLIEYSAIYFRSKKLKNLFEYRSKRVWILQHNRAASRGIRGTVYQMS